MNKTALYLYFLILTSTLSFAQVGINTEDPKSSLDINGNMSVKVVSLAGSASATVISDGVYINVNPQLQDQEFMLPNPVSFPGRMYFIRNVSGSTAKLTTAAGLLFSKNNSTGAGALYMYEGNFKSIIIVSDGANWTYF